MSLDYPSTLPNPVKAGHTPKARVSATDLPGPGTYESRERDYSGTMAVEFFLTAEQAAEFYIWWRDDLIEGGRWFNCTWPSLRPGPMVVQFLQEPVFNHVYGGATRVSGVVQVRGASLPVSLFLDILPVATFKQDLASTPVVLPAHLPGDLILLWACDIGGIPSLPAGYTSVLTKATVFGESYRLSYVVDVAGTITQVACPSSTLRLYGAIYRNAVAVGAAAVTAETGPTQTASIPGLSLSNASGMSRVFAGMYTNQSETVVPALTGHTPLVDSLSPNLGAGDLFAYDFLATDTAYTGGSISGLTNCFLSTWAAEILAGV